jgi:hypothetical protein
VQGFACWVQAYRCVPSCFACTKLTQRATGEACTEVCKRPFISRVHTNEIIDPWNLNRPCAKPESAGREHTLHATLLSNVHLEVSKLSFRNFCERGAKTHDCNAAYPMVTCNGTRPFQWLARPVHCISTPWRRPTEVQSQPSGPASHSGKISWWWNVRQTSSMHSASIDALGH